MSGTDAVNTDEHTKSSLILTVSQSGSVCSVVEASEAQREELAAVPESFTVDQLWPVAITDTQGESAFKPEVILDAH